MIKEKINSDSLLKPLSRIPLHPNHITLIAVIFSILAFLAFQADPVYSIILFALAFFIDAVDGVVARARNLVSKEGAFLDGVSDRLVEFFLILTIIVYLSTNQIILISSISVLFFGTCMTSYVKAYSHHQGVSTEEEAKKMNGILQRAERVILLSANLILFIFVPEYAVYLLIITALLSIVTFIQRVLSVLE